MPQRVDVGSVLGGRYKVTGEVTASAEEDLVLDGVDQVLNRSVSILVAGPENAEQVATSAREIATGERPGNVQVLDLGLADGRTYLVTNHTSAADLLDLVVAANPPYVEPFFTDTLGTEIFGQARPTEPEHYDDRYQHVRYEDEPQPAVQTPPARTNRPIVPPPPSAPPRSAGRAPESGDNDSAGTGATAAAAAGAAGTASGATQQHRETPPPTTQKPKVTLWDDNDYGHVDEEPRRGPRDNARPGYGAAAAGAGAASGRAASHFPAAARGTGGTPPDYDDEADRKKNPGFTRWLVGGVLAVLLIAAVVLAVGQLGSMFQPTASDPSGADQEASAPESQPEDTSGSSNSASPEESQSASPSPSESADAGVQPVAQSVTRLVPDAPDLDAVNDGALPQTIDDNPATSWNSLLYANDTFGGFASNLALVVGLQEQSTITQVQLEQLNGSGGSFEILLNDQPTLEGAQQVAQGSFTAPSITLPVPESNGEPRTAQYVIINFTELPQLANSNGPFPWGIKLAEINIS